MTQNILSGRIAVVTGATSGIGAATARRFVAEGASVAILGRREDRLKELAAELGGTVLPVATDVSDQDAVNAAAERVRAELGRADLVVANAGVMLAAPFEAADTREWDEMIATNLNGLLYTGRAFIPDLLAAAEEGKQADLIHVGSIGGHLIFPNFGVYAATKAFVAHLSRNLRTELAPRRVRVKNVEPGIVVTELGDGMKDASQKEFVANWRDSLTPLVPEDLADTIAYAASLPAHVNIPEFVVMPTNQA
jgi:NADP-dependent 3-hydroxy acid dehydrogenase YdfG